eukprot:TRINITY_DN27726_c0_g1_i1.p1 TRINITY_DN27726_c0_g1~~TRINITY_DN27726_c0_g1_i1.p1  ORF type:complete len:1214 (+),score=412.51 TRINITY_DN27726_c0_g1_i1:63-3704(+)
MSELKRGASGRAGGLRKTNSMRSGAVSGSNISLGDHLANKASPRAEPKSTKDNVERLDDQYEKVMANVQYVPRLQQNEERLWQAIEKLGDINRVQRAQLLQLSSSQGRFRGKISKEAKELEDKYVLLKQKETEVVTRRREEFEGMVRDYGKTMDSIRNEVMQEQKQRRNVEQLYEEEMLQTKMAKEAYLEVKGWYDSATGVIEELKLEKAHHEVVEKDFSDERIDMTTKISNLHTEVQVRDEKLDAMAQECDHKTRLKDEAEGVAAQHEVRITEQENQAVIVERENAAEHSRLVTLVARLNEEIDVLKENTKRWEDFDKMCPDYQLLLKQMEAKDGLIHRSQQLIATKHSDETALQSSVDKLQSGVKDKAADFARVEDRIENIVTSASGGDIGRAYAPRTIVACYPDPCPVGRDLTLVITTCDTAGRPVRGADQEEFKVSRMHYPVDGGCVPGEGVSVQDVSTEGRKTSTFSCAVPVREEGRAGFQVQFRGCSFTATASCPLPHRPSTLDDGPDEGQIVPETGLEEHELYKPARIPRITISCTPNTVTAGEAVDVNIMVREPGSLLPCRDTSIPMDVFKLSPYTSAQGLRFTNPLRQIPLTPIFTTTVDVQGVVQGQGKPMDYVGIEVMIQGGAEVARGSVKLVGDAKCDEEWDPSTTTIHCAPDPAYVGEEVSVYVVPRNSQYLPLDAALRMAPFPSLKPNGSTVRVEECLYAEGLGAQIFVGKMTPSEAGRCGVNVHMGGRVVGGAGVAVLPAEDADPSKTVFEMTPANIVAAGETVQISITTKSAMGRDAPGPEPSSIRLTPLGNHVQLYPLRRVGGSDCKYVATLRTLPESKYTTTGVTVDIDGVTFSQRIRVSAEPADEPVVNPPRPEAELPAVPKYSAYFQSAEVQPHEVIPLIICGNRDEPQRRRPPAIPVVTPAANTVLEGPVTPVVGSRHAWRCLVRSGPLAGTASVTVEVDGQAYSASATVSRPGVPMNDLEAQLLRLQKLELHLRKFVGEVEERSKDMDERERELQRREMDLALRQEQFHRSLQRPDGNEHEQLYLMFGLALSDGIQYGYQWDTVDGAKVVEVIPDGPVDRTGKVIPGDILREVTYVDEQGMTQKCAVHQMEDFKRVARLLSAQGNFGETSLTFYSPEENAHIGITLHPASSPSPPGRPLGVRRHPSRADSVTGSPRTSPARSRRAASPGRSLTGTPTHGQMNALAEGEMSG